MGLSIGDSILSLLSYFFNNFPVVIRQSERLNKKLKTFVLLPVIALEILQFLLDLCVVFTGHYIVFIFFKLVNSPFSFSEVLFVGRSFAWWLVSANMYLKLL